MAARSYLFVPGDHPDRFEKAWNAGADAVIIDLEDAVSVEEKPAAREVTASWLSPERPVYVRVNQATTEWFEDDLRAISRPGLAGVMLPKAEEPEQVAKVASRLGAPVIPTLETALGAWNARALAEAPGVERLAFGPVDFRLDTGILGEGEELLYVKTRMVLASRVAGILPPLDGVTVALDDPERLAADVERAPPRLRGQGVHTPEAGRGGKRRLPPDARRGRLGGEGGPSCRNGGIGSDKARRRVHRPAGGRTRQSDP